MTSHRWQVDFSRDAVEDLHDLDAAVGRRVRKKLEWLSENLEQVSLKPLRADLSGLFRLRVGDWRVVLRTYEDRRLVVVLAVAHRRVVYDLAKGRVG